MREMHIQILCIKFREIFNGPWGPPRLVIFQALFFSVFYTLLPNSPPGLAAVFQANDTQFHIVMLYSAFFLGF
jgi:hypothetical protein